MTDSKTTKQPSYGVIVGKAQLAVAMVALCVLIPSVIYTIVAARSCTGLGCTSSLAAMVVASISFAFALLLIPSIGWLKGKRWAPIVNLVMLLPLIVAGFLVYAIRHDIAQDNQSRPVDIGLGLNVATQDLPVIESTIGYLINEKSASQPFVISERTLDYGDDDYATQWDECIRDAGLRQDLVRDFRVKAHNSVLLPGGFGIAMGVEVSKAINIAGDSGFLYAFTRPGFSSDSSLALIYIEARAQMDGWGMHYLLEHVGTKWTVARALCGWIS